MTVTEARLVLTVVTVAWLAATVVARKRISDDLVGREHRGQRAGFCAAVTGAMRTGSMTAWSMMTTYQTVARLVAVASPLVALALCVPLVGYAPAADLG